MAPPRPNPSSAWLRQAVQLHRAGRLAEAAALYDEGLKRDPGHGDALHLSGLVAHQQGRHADAIARITRAIDGAPTVPDYRHSRGQARRESGDHAGAEEDFTAAVTLNPNHLQGWVNLGISRLGRGAAQAALEAFGRAAELSPQSAEIEAYRGAALIQTGDFPGAIVALKRAIVLDANFAEAHFNLAVAQDRAGDATAAERAFRRALTVNPFYPKAWNNLGLLLARAGRRAEARACLERGASHAKAGSREAAELWNNLGLVREEEGDIAGAVEAFGRSLQDQPANARTRLNRGDALLTVGVLDEALADYAQARAADPKFELTSRRELLALLFHHEDPATQRDAAKAWAATLPAASPHDFANDRDPQRRLRLGYVSPDFYRHAVASFVEPALEAHDRAGFELFAYAEVRRSDAVTERLRERFDHWRDTRGMSDTALADAIRADRIDILIDLAGHTADSRLAVFAARPAPIQLSWIGYPATSGLTQIDWRVTDTLADPPGMTETHYTEKLLRLPGGFNVYRPPVDAPDVGPSPCATNGFVTFGSFNFAPKLSPATLDLWAELLRLVPDSRLLIKHRGFDYPPVRIAYHAWLARHSLAPDRVEFMGMVAESRRHLDVYNRVDIALDPFPYNGTTTTAEALWMGAPVITLAGATHRARVGVSMLTRVGLSDLIARSPAEYLERARGLAADRAKLGEMRAALRGVVAASALCNGARLTHELEDSLRGLWREWTNRS